MKPKSYLILGGARSGKTRRALQIGEGFAERIYIATAEALDEEMAARIGEHRRERGADWATVEAPLDLAGAIVGISSRDAVAVVDCLTLWLSNLMGAGHDIAAARDRLLAAAADCPAATIVFVSNEVGLGLAPQTPLGRAFRDQQGWLNQAVAAAVDQVELMVAGIPLRVKP